MNELPSKPLPLQDHETRHHGAFDPNYERHFRAVSQPIYQTSLFAFRDFDDMANAYAGNPGGPIYARGDNPTVMAFEREIARLENTQASRAFASGMGAISATVMALVEPGDRIVTVHNVYSDAYRLFETMLRPMGVAIDYVDGTKTDAVIDAISGAKLLFLESPTSLTFELQDLENLAQAAKQKNVITVIDNSWATPVFQRPAEHGIDLVIHAASKFLSGHSDTVAGVVTGRKDLINKINGSTFPYLGGKLGPFEAWLLLRGLDTLELRMQRHAQTGEYLAASLTQHPKVSQVLYTGFSDHCGKRTLHGHSSLFSIILDKTVDIRNFSNALRTFRLGVSWGGPESLVVPAAAVLHQKYEISAFRHFQLDPQLVRIYCGLENPSDLLADLEQAIGAGVTS
ncbi:aminotransferase class I/II-fold pyridoxal phosphate-dependent enzyme [Thalassospira povalilytica]|uniref:Methionine gamma-lyase n=1 Tax=Thalassospira povalilytica TaxID=732237 RepID=A0ABX4RET6_9PROT|nr:aminotransferase class I/II-fold pyridoxal phosphate-dependent enzyme [Thalassospira povalilytica]PKR52486.1 hypothetical protein CU041_02515 [Thalassospira povalilytica]